MPLDPKFLRAEELGIRLEVVSGLSIWEAHPVWKHQKAIDRIRASIARKAGGACLCVHASDVYVQFPDGSLKRPDIAIFCREPDEAEDAILLVPETVIEVVSKGYEPFGSFQKAVLDIDGRAHASNVRPCASRYNL